MNKTLFAKEIRSNLFVSTVITIVLIMYVVVVVGMFDPELGKSLDIMMASMPEVFAAFGMANQSSTLLDFLINYLYGFLLTLFPFVLVLILANKLMVRYVDRGTMAYLLATPNSRVKIATTLALVFVVLLALVLAINAIVAFITAEMMFPGELDGIAFLQLNVGLFGLWLFLAGLCFCSACIFSNAGRALWVGGGLGIGFFLLQMVTQISDELEFLNNINPVMLFDPYGLASGEGQAILGAVALAAMGVILLVIGIVTFSRRDLSI